MNQKTRDLSWPDVQEYLRIVHQHLPELVEKCVLIGGAACLYHRFRFEKVKDKEFALRSYSAQEEQQWLSKDVDFALLPDVEFPDVRGLRVGTVQFGMRLSPEQFDENAQPVTLTYADGFRLHLKIADSIDMYREKDATRARRNQPHDYLHFEMLRELLIFQICRALDNSESKQAAAFLDRAKSYCEELFSDDRVRKRLGR